MTDRRTFLIGGAATVGAIVAAPRAVRASPSASPFTLGVASGDPAPDGVVLWTRLATTPLAADGHGGMTGPVSVAWEVAADEAFTQVVRSGTAVADYPSGHSVHVEVSGLAPGTWYFYRFTTGGRCRRWAGPAPRRPLPTRRRR